MDMQVSIEQVEQEIAALIGRVSNAGTRIVVTLRGKPQAALINMEDYERLVKSEQRSAEIEQWLGGVRAFSKNVQARHGQIDVDSILSANREDLEQR